MTDQHKEVLVTVAISTYNHERFVGRCIQSVQEQDVSPIEIIILDDCSTDGTREVIERFLTDARIRYLRNAENLGPRTNNTRALDIGSGRYHVWLHGDDYLLPGHLERIINGLEAHPECSLGYAPPVFVDERDKILQQPTHPGRPEHDYAGGRNELALLLIHDNYIVPSSVVFRRSELQRVGNFHPTVPGADWDLYTRFAINNPNFYYAGTAGVGYRFHPGQVSVQFYATTDPLKAHLHVIEQAMRSTASERLRGFEREILGLLDRRIESFGAAAWELDHEIRRIRSGLARQPSTPTSTNAEQKPTVSVVIPCYRQAQYLADALDSVAGQGFTDWECVVVDDGSPDDTGQVATGFAETRGDGKIRVITQPNRGLASARNAGISEARGRYILPLDADDKLHPDFLAETVAVLEQDPDTAIVYVDEQNFGLAEHIYVKGESSLEALKRHNVHDYCSLYRRAVWEQSGGYSPAMYLGGEDWEFWLAAAACGFRSRHLSRPLFLYRNRQNTMVAETRANLAQVHAQLVLHHSHLFDEREVSGAEERLKYLPPKQRRKLARVQETHPDNPLLRRFAQLAETETAELPPELPPLNAAPLVSVIVTTMDRPNLLTDALNSLLGQTYEHWEAVVVNDGGEDIGDRIATADRSGRIKYIHHPHNRGLSAARNTGISLSSGDILCYLDDDDRLLPEHLETIVTAMHRSGAGLVYTEAEYVSERVANGERIELSRTAPYSHIDYSLERLHIGNFVPVNTWAHRRELIACAGDFDVTLDALEDWDLLLRLARITVPEHVQRITAEVRLRPGAANDNMSQRARGELPALHRRIYARYPLPGNDDVERKRAQTLAQLETAQRGGEGPKRTPDPYVQWQQQHALTENKAQYMAERMMLTWQHRPSVQLIVIHHAGKHDALADTLDSLGQQLYPGWGLSVVSSRPCPDDSFDRLPNLEWAETHGELIDGVNSVIGDSRADWIVRLNAGTIFSPDALLRWVDYINLHPQWQLFYCDDDRITADGTRHQPLFKPDFNLDLLRSTPYMGDVVPVKRDLLVRIGGFSEIGSAGVYDAVLRVLDTAGESAVGHIPEVLVHHRDLPGVDRDAAASAETGRLAVLAHLDRNQTPAQVVHNAAPGTYFVDYQINDEPAVSVLVPVGGRYRGLRVCVTSLLDQTRYPDYEVILADNTNVEDAGVLDALAEEGDGKVHVFRRAGTGGIASLIDFAANQAQGELLLVLDPETQVVHPEWLTRMVANVLRPEIGVVGARLIDLHGRIKHAGLVLGMQNGAGCVFAGHDMQSAGYLERLQTAQNYSAVAGACMLFSRELMVELGGLTEDAVAEGYYDVDFCLRARQAGYKVAWTPFATLLHHGATPPTQHPSPPAKPKSAADIAVLLRRWPGVLENDPAYNRNLSLAHGDMRVEGELAVPWTPPDHPRPRVWAFPLNAQGIGEYRVRQPLAALDRAARAEFALLPDHEGVERARVPTVCELNRADPDSLLIQHGFTDLFLRWLPRYRKSGHAFLVFGLDDNLLAIPDHNNQRHRFPGDLERRLREALSQCHRLLVPTEPLAELYRQFVEDVRVVPNLLEQNRWGQLTPQRQRGAKPRVGWVGAQQHSGDLAILAPVMEALAGEVHWVMMGLCPRALRHYVTEFHQPVAYRHYPEKLASLNLDLALAPLEINAFNECKSDLRILEYGALGWPVIATDIAPYRGPPVTCVPNDPHAWIGTIRERMDDLDRGRPTTPVGAAAPDLGKRSGSVARESVLPRGNRAVSQLPGGGLHDRTPNPASRGRHQATGHDVGAQCVTRAMGWTERRPARTWFRAHALASKPRARQSSFPGTRLAGRATLWRCDGAVCVGIAGKPNVPANPRPRRSQPAHPHRVRPHSSFHHAVRYFFNIDARQSGILPNRVHTVARIQYRNIWTENIPTCGPW